MLEPRPYQLAIIDEIRGHMKQGIKSILAVSPTGSGKTVLSAMMVKSAHSKNMCTWFINHRIELVNQTAQTFKDVGIPFGICAAGFSQHFQAPVQICSIQTLARRYGRYKEPHLIVWDEAAHLPSKSWDKIYRLYPNAFHVLLTATPMRLDGRGLGEYAQKMVQGPTVEWLIRNKFLSPYKLYAPDKVNLQGVHTKMGDYDNSELQEVMDKPKIVGNAIHHYRKYADGKRALIFAVSIQASKHIAEQFSLEGIPARHIDGDTPTDERLETMEQFAQGHIKVVSNVSLFGEGLDIRALECVIHLRPTKSTGLFLQICGRALRAFPGKKEAIIIDAVGNIYEHGLPDEERKWSLEGRDKSKGEYQAPVRICPQCFGAQKPQATCEFCGFLFPIKFREIEQIKGDLKEIDEAAQLALKLKWKKQQGMAKGYKELIAIGKSRGYKKAEQWAWFILRGRQAKKLKEASNA